MANAGAIIGGLILIIIAGVFNGSWNAAFSPKANLAVGRPEPRPNHNEHDDENENNNQQEETMENMDDLTYHHAFALFQIYAALINIPICLYWAGGPARVSAILSEAKPTSILLIAVFSIIWGIGTLCFGLACKIAGVGLGTNLSMGIIAVIGTFLPLITEKTLISPAGGVICGGLLICCGGLWLSTLALKKRDADEAILAIAKKAKTNRLLDKMNTRSTRCEEILQDNNNNNNESNGNDCESPDKDEGNTKSNNENLENMPLRTSRYLFLRRLTASFVKSPERKKQEAVDHPTWKKILVCVVTGVTASQLQFAFIFGKEITNLALDIDIEEDISASIPGSTPESGGAAIIWLLAISLGAPVAIINGIYSSPVPLSTVIRAPWWRHLRVICTTSLPWISHIHIYGVCATTLLPDKVAASIGWPLLMMITQGQAMMLSIWIGEWKKSSAMTIRTLCYSLLASFVGIVVLMSSVALPTS